MKGMTFAPLRPKPALMRWDVLPFVVLYPPAILFAVCAPFPVWVCHCVPMLTLLVQAVTFLLSYWSVHLKARIRFQPAKGIPQASHVLVTKHFHKENRTRSSLCPILLKIDGQTQQKYVDYYKQECVYDPAKDRFFKPKLSVEMSFRHYCDSTGISKNSELKDAIAKYGKNNMEIPMPKFMDLFREHVVAPFFVFQIFCTLLWMLEDYWYFSLASFVMLFIFESVVIISRLKNMQRIRGMRIRHRDMLVHRNGTWKSLSSDELVPGDIVCLQNKAKGEPDNRLPCDMLLLSGTCTVDESILTGESIPQIKEPVTSRDNLDEVFSIKSGVHKAHVLWGKTEIVQCMRDADRALGVNVTNPPSRQSCVAYVLRTGFQTTQGKLVRTVLFSAERVTVESKDAFFFLLVLLFFALLASVYVLYSGLHDPDRDKYRVVVKSILILASVVPPELPMELSLAVNNSILSLIKHAIFCTEPYRIPAAGRVTVCCFDKTGTLTSDKMRVDGVVDTAGKTWKISELRQERPDAMYVLGLCHSIAMSDSKTILGDPLERLAFEELEWRYNPQKERGSSRDNEVAGIIACRYPFSSVLKRMSVIAEIKLNDSGQWLKRVLSKGAPEVMRSLLKDVPDQYDATVKSLTKKGARVLCLAYKDIASTEKIPRQDAERDLIFCGFIVTSCPLKPDTKRKIEELRDSKHKIVIITGDNQYTAVHVADELKIVDPNKMLYLRKKQTGEGAEIEVANSEGKVACSSRGFEDVKKALQGNQACIDGDCLAYIDELAAWTSSQKEQVIGDVTVFARTSPSQKDLIIGVLNQRGEVTLMCGDGTNDVGSLKRAHIGIALINKEETDAEKKANKALFRRAMMEDVSTIGDACIAAPFTYKYESIKSVTYVLRQGRCTLVTTLQMYKILAINGLMLAYSLSVLYQLGLKSGDFQSAVFGIPIAFYFFLISRAQPLRKLQPFRPPTSIFELSQISSVALQFVVHLAGLVYLTDLSYRHTRPEDLSKPDAEFKPSVMNTVVFLYLTFVDATNFLLNYQGEPFMESIWKNKILINVLLVHMGVVLMAAFDMSADLRWLLELHELPLGFPRMALVGTMLLDFSICYAFKAIINWKLYSK